ncbi:hypothetical protein HDK77DRAFT_444710 [Phyllosticta capitalensis]
MLSSVCRPLCLCCCCWPRVLVLFSRFYFTHSLTLLKFFLSNFHILGRLGREEVGRYFWFSHDLKVCTHLVLWVP